MTVWAENLLVTGWSSLLSSCLKSTLETESVDPTCCSVSTDRNKGTSCLPHTSFFYWLPVKSRIGFKTLPLIFLTLIKPGSETLWDLIRNFICKMSSAKTGRNVFFPKSCVLSSVQFYLQLKAPIRDSTCIKTLYIKRGKILERKAPTIRPSDMSKPLVTGSIFRVESN